MTNIHSHRRAGHLLSIMALLDADGGFWKRLGRRRAPDKTPGHLVEAMKRQAAEKRLRRRLKRLGHHPGGEVWDRAMAQFSQQDFSSKSG